MASSEPKPWCVYCITNIVNGMKYIGITKRGIATRWACHVWDAQKRKEKKSKVQRAIRKYGPDAFSVHIVSNGLTREEAISREMQLIDSLKTFGRRGYNLTKGGDGTLGNHHSPSPDARAKMRAAKLGHKLSNEHKKRIAAVHKGRKNTPETISKMRAAAATRKRYVFTDEHRAKITAALKGRVVTPETRAKIGAANRGKSHPVSPETRVKISEANRNRPPNPERGRKISAAKKGKPFSEAHKAALREAWIRRKAVRRR